MRKSYNIKLAPSSDNGINWSHHPPLILNSTTCIEKSFLYHFDFWEGKQSLTLFSLVLFEVLIIFLGLGPKMDVTYKLDGVKTKLLFYATFFTWDSIENGSHPLKYIFESSNLFQLWADIAHTCGRFTDLKPNTK